MLDSNWEIQVYFFINLFCVKMVSKYSLFNFDEYDYVVHWI